MCVGEKETSYANDRGASRVEKEESSAYTAHVSGRTLASPSGRHSTTSPPQEHGPESEDAKAETKVIPQLGTVRCQPDTSRAACDSGVVQPLGPTAWTAE